MNINIKVNGRTASLVSASDRLVCDNTDYVALFEFSPEWSVYPTKTARFVWNGQYEEVIFTGNACPIPAVNNTMLVAIGVYAGELRTTTPALIGAEPSILSGYPSHVDPPEDVYNQLMEQFAKMGDLNDLDTEAKDTLVHAINEVYNSGGGGGASTWNQLSGKPFATIGENLKVVNGALCVDTAPNVEQDNTKPITSAAVYTEVGNINSLLAII